MAVVGLRCVIATFTVRFPLI